MTPSKVQLKREKGLCFTCDDKYTPTHKFPQQTILGFTNIEDVNINFQPDPSDNNGHTELIRMSLVLQ